jgi:hypothetical protein
MGEVTVHEDFPDEGNTNTSSSSRYENFSKTPPYFSSHIDFIQMLTGKFLLI